MTDNGSFVCAEFGTGLYEKSVYKNGQTNSYKLSMDVHQHLLKKAIGVLICLNTKDFALGQSYNGIIC
jgi:hypothetical protein